MGEELIKRLGAYVAYQVENVISRLPEDCFVEGGWTGEVCLT